MRPQLPPAFWILIASFVPGLVLIAVGTIQARRGAMSTREHTRLNVLGGSLLRIVPALAIVGMVAIGEMQGAALFAAAVLVGMALLRLWALSNA